MCPAYRLAARRGFAALLTCSLGACLALAGKTGSEDQGALQAAHSRL